MPVPPAPSRPSALRLLGDAADLVLPRRCVGCRAPGGAWCAACRPARAPFAVHVRFDAGVPVLAAVTYGGAVRAAVLARKERDRRDLTGPCAALLAGAVEQAVRGLSRPRDAVLVAVPSSPAAVRERHADHARRLAGAAGRRTGHRVLPLLRHARLVRDSAGLGAAARATNLRGAMIARPPRGDPRPVIVVDDVVTTGASLAESVRALRSAGWPVAAAAVVAAVPYGARAPIPNGTVDTAADTAIDTTVGIAHDTVERAVR